MQGFRMWRLADETAVRRSITVTEMCRMRVVQMTVIETCRIRAPSGAQRGMRDVLHAGPQVRNLAHQGAPHEGQQVRASGSRMVDETVDSQSMTVIATCRKRVAKCSAIEFQQTMQRTPPVVDGISAH